MYAHTIVIVDVSTFTGSTQIQHSICVSLIGAPGNGVK